LVVWGAGLQALVVWGAIQRTGGSLRGFFVFNPKIKYKEKIDKLLKKRKQTEKEELAVGGPQIQNG
jgi:5-formaminoimidazole-4-carboxamide-1-beta-D-ribofuranosyl 5'-monophosphate synthetase